MKCVCEAKKKTNSLFLQIKIVKEQTVHNTVSI